ncbi:hypothetical protein DOTSEDRAFT_87055 [Dothistroma septosporum NZE10]|uniref:Uncharacterized protein n=1 Tax=Dothistroma septosporum (strain NZE10 / CBS 128990) TaxID=675120 RepID=N1PU93_DOTSN|nr:hypothetical protein DOTSEDRAFT_87055 [Dothistroma septosporum NZE10]
MHNSGRSERWACHAPGMTKHTMSMGHRYRTLAGPQMIGICYAAPVEAALFGAYPEVQACSSLGSTAISSTGQRLKGHNNDAPSAMHCTVQYSKSASSNRRMPVWAEQNLIFIAGSLDSGSLAILDRRCLNNTLLCVALKSRK